MTWRRITLNARAILHSLIASLFLTSPAPVWSQTKPSEVFFSQSADRSFGSDLIPAPSIVAKDVVLRGWLVKEDIPSPFSQAVFVNEITDNTGKVDIGYEDVHYDLILDYDFIQSRYGRNPGVLSGAMVHGNPVDSNTTAYPIQDVGLDGTPLGVDINSFWLPNAVQLPISFHTELNAWHQHGSHHCGLLGAFCFFYRNFDGMGTAPSGWIEKEYTSPLPSTSADNWWPFDPDNPDGQSANLQVGDYVEIQGALWEDTWHDANSPANCWTEKYHNHGGSLEIHPVDSLRRLPSPGPSPVFANDKSAFNISLDSAKAGIKRTIPVSMCSDAQGATNGTFYAVCADSVISSAAPPPERKPQQLMPHVLELIDGRFSSVDKVDHGATIGNDDCVRIAVSWPSGLPWAHYKATYVVWWTIPPPAVTAVSPSKTECETSTPVTITGSSFYNVQDVNLDGRYVLSPITVVSPTQITTTIPNSIPSGPHVVTVDTAQGSSTSASGEPPSATFFVTPKVTSVSPLTGPVGGGTFVQVHGACLDIGSGISFGNLKAAQPSCNGATCDVFSPTGIAVGAVDVQASIGNPAALSTINPGDQFTYTPPSVTKISPSTGPATGGTIVQITGAGFTQCCSGSMGVSFKGAGSSSPPQATAQCTAPFACTVVTPPVSPPSPLPYAVDLIANAFGASSSPSSADVFTYNSLYPALTSIYQLSYNRYPTPSQFGVQLNGNAPSGGAKIILSSSDPSVLVQNVPVSAAGASATVAVTILPTATAKSSVTITANYMNSSVSTSVPVPAWPPLSLVSDSPTLANQQSTNVTVILNTPAPANAVVTLSSKASTSLPGSPPMPISGAVSMPGTVTIAAGQYYATFTVTSNYPGNIARATIAATYGTASNTVSASTVITLTSRKPKPPPSPKE